MTERHPPAAPPPAATAPARRRPLLLTADESLLDDLLRLAAAAGVEVDLAPDPAAARGRYSTAPLVVVGVDLATALIQSRLPRRAGVVLVSRSEAGANPWEYVDAVGAAHVALLPAAATWVVEQLSDSARDRPNAPAAVLAVVNGRGGAGSSVLATGLAVTAAAADRRVLLLDSDPYGGGLDLALGWEDERGLRWPELAGTAGRIEPPALLSALPARGPLALLSFDRSDSAGVPATAMAAVLEAARAVRDLVVVDLPRQLDPAAEVALQAADRCLLLVPAEVRAATAAVRVARDLGRHCHELGVVVRGPSPGGLSPEEISESLRLPVVGTLRPETGLPAELESGQPPAGDGRGPLAVLCRALLTQFAPPAGSA